MAGRALSPIYLDDDEARPLPLAISRSRRRRIVFGWYGGKFNHLDWLLPLLPAAHHYCEPFSGSAAVLLNRIPAPVETYNDVDGDVVNFFRVLREQPEELSRGHRADTVFSGGIPSRHRRHHARRFTPRARATILCPRSAGADGSCPNRHVGALGKLQRH
jgi:DNA adenine methylase